MSDKIDDGGLAFPGSRYEEFDYGGSSNQLVSYPGMTLRDWFAGQVLASAAALPLGEKDCRFRANVAYEMADAMLKARQS